MAQVKTVKITFYYNTIPLCQLSNAIKDLKVHQKDSKEEIWHY